MPSKYRYDLNGNEGAKLSFDDKRHAKSRIIDIMGRLKLEEKYQDLIPKKRPIVEPKSEKSYGYLYYFDRIGREFKQVLRECYGKGCVVDKKYDEIEGKFHCKIALTLPTGDVMTAESIGEIEDVTMANCTKKILVRLQNTIQAYPFEYKKPKMKEEDIV